MSIEHLYILDCTVVKDGKQLYAMRGSLNSIFNFTQLLNIKKKEKKKGTRTEWDNKFSTIELKAGYGINKATI